MRLFDSASEAYDVARPSYPPALYDLLESECGGLSGRTIGDGGAGTGVVARALVERHANVVAFDPGPRMLRRAIARTPDLRAVVGEGAAIPLRDACLDLICFGQSWHWVGQSDGALEVARVLREGGWWVAWWNHPWADSEEWFERYWSLLEARCAGVSRDQRNVDWCSEAIGSVGRFLAPVRNTIEWERRVSVENWLIDLSSHAYVIDISEGERTRLLRDVRSVLHHAFANGPMVLPYQTRIWMARLAN